VRLGSRELPDSLVSLDPRVTSVLPDSPKSRVRLDFPAFLANAASMVNPVSMAKRETVDCQAYPVPLDLVERRDEWECQVFVVRRARLANQDFLETKGWMVVRV